MAIPPLRPLPAWLSTRLTLVTCLTLLIAGSTASLTATAQNFGGDLFPELEGSGFGADRYGQSGGDIADRGAGKLDPAVWSARYVSDPQREGIYQLQVTAKLQPDWHIYSLTQGPGGPKPTKLTTKSLGGLQPASDWSTTEPPHVTVSDVFAGVKVEQFDDHVTFTQLLRVSGAGAGGDRGPVEIDVDALACGGAGACLPISETVMAAYDGDADQALDGDVRPVAAVFRDEGSVVQWTASLQPAVIPPGGTAELVFTATPDEGFHVYSASTHDADNKTVFVLTEKSDLRVGAPVTDSTERPDELMPGVTYHAGAVTWRLPVAAPADLTVGARRIAGAVAYQACSEGSCQQPQAIAFEAELLIDPKVATPPRTSLALAPVGMRSYDRAETLDMAAVLPWVDQIAAAAPLQNVAETSDSSRPTGLAGPATGSPATVDPSFAWILLLAFGGGVILNVMPCVLPVLGLKVMSFVKQAGQDRRRILGLNLATAAGILVVFAGLATLAATVKFSWGEQFTYFPVRLGLTVGLFALALSYLGVWEIPVPGGASGATATSLQAKEGYPGAFFKGVFATILATPCSGPLLGYIFGLSLGLPGPLRAAVILVVGLGMAMPFIAIGFFPAASSWLPKPGAWMETFKQFLAFLFLATVAFFFFGFKAEQQPRLFTALIGVWFGCWVIGLVPMWKPIGQRLIAWGGGLTAAIAIGFAAFTFNSGPTDVAWQPYSEARLQQLQAQGRTVMLDFTASWCGNCKWNSAFAVDTKPTAEMIERLGAVALLADWSDPNTEIKAKLNELQSDSIPVLAIYPGKNPSNRSCCGIWCRSPRCSTRWSRPVPASTRRPRRG